MAEPQPKKLYEYYDTARSPHTPEDLRDVTIGKILEEPGLFGEHPLYAMTCTFAKRLLNSVSPIKYTRRQEPFTHPNEIADIALTALIRRVFYRRNLVVGDPLELPALMRGFVRRIIKQELLENPSYVRTHLEYQDEVHGLREQDDDEPLSLTEEVRDEIRRVLPHLKPIYREVIRRYYLERDSLADIARSLQAKKATVRQRKSRGDRLLVSLLKKLNWRGAADSSPEGD